MTEPPASPEQLPKWRDPATVATIATAAQVLVGIAATWFLLQQLAPILRPLLIAVFLGYVLMPQHSRLRKRVGGPAAITVLACVSAGVLVGLGLAVYASVLGLSEDLPRLQQRGLELIHMVERLSGESPSGAMSEAKLEQQLNRATGPLLTFAADVLMDACVVAMYLLFLLLEGARLPDRVRKAYPTDRADTILIVADQVNSAIAAYLRVKVRASLVLAIPVGIILWACGVKFALLWAILTFMCNFIPYVGPVVALGTPVGFAFLWFGPTWQPITATALLLLCHALSAAVIEPTMIGNAVGLSPFVLLGALAFWGLLWGIAGMLLAVPLTVVAVIVMDHFESTRAMSRLLRGG